MDDSTKESSATIASSPTSETAGWKAFISKLQNLKTRYGSPQPPHAESSLEPESTAATSLEEELFPRGDQLKPAERIFFHTAPNARIPSIKAYGLYANEKDPNIGDNFGYSLYFGHEHGVMRNNHNSHDDPRIVTPDDYSMTIWRPGFEIVRSNEENLGRRNRFMIPEQQVESDDLPDEFLEASPTGYRFKVTSEKARHVGPENLIGILPLAKDHRDCLQEQMLRLQLGLTDGEGVESTITKLIDDGSELFNGVTKEELAHDLTASIEHSLLRTTISPLIKKVRQYSTVNERSPHYSSTMKALWKVLVYRTSVNDPVSARYLDGCINLLDKILKDQNIDPAKTKQQLLQSIKHFKEGEKDEINTKYSCAPEGEDFNFYGFTSSTIALHSLRKDLGI